MVMKNRKEFAKCLLFVLAFSLPTLSWGTDLRSQMLANPCLSCHGPDKQSAGSIPPVVGMSAENIQSALLDFKNDKRMGTVMNRIAKGYTDEEIAALANFFTR